MGPMTELPKRPILVVVTPVFNEADVLGRFAEEVARTLFSLADIDVYVLLVDDGSSDGSWPLIQDLVQRSDRFSAIRLSRNFGSHTALLAGFDFVRPDADIVATLACDLQDPPETIGTFIEQWHKGADIVWGARRSRADKSWRSASSRLLEQMLRRYVMPRHSLFQTGSFFLIDRIVLDCVRRFREQSRVTFALVAWTGFDQAVVAYDRQQRVGGRSKWTFGQMLNTAYDVLIGFSPLPAKVFTVFGFAMLVISLLAVAYIVGDWMFSKVLPGWTALMATMTLCFGLVFVMLGLSFEYLYRIFIEAKDRPLYFVARRIGDVHPRKFSDE
jgi:glycosyltransferase involved in cell wall biosynthesis